MKKAFLFLSLISLACTREVKEITEEAPKVDSVEHFAPISISSEDMEVGRDVFRKNCACCHSFERFIAAPQLIYRPIENYFYLYIRNSDSLAKSGDPLALKLKRDYPFNTMPAYVNVLSDDEIKSVVEYINYRTTNPVCK